MALKVSFILSLQPVPLILTRYKLPFTLQIIKFQLRGPGEVKKSFWDGNKIGRSYRLFVSLMDASDKPTVSDGEIIYALVAEKPMSLGSLATEGLGELGNSDSALRKAIARSTHHDIVAVSKDGFAWKDFTIHSFQQQTQHTKLCFAIDHLSPPLFFRQGWRVEIHVWFRLPSKKMLYDRSGVSWS